jgi:hypothetical protein
VAAGYRRTMTKENPRTDDPNPGDHSEDEEPHHALNNPADSPDETEWPDPYDDREDPRGPGDEAPPQGATSTSAPRGPQDDEAEFFEAPERDKLDE